MKQLRMVMFNVDCRRFSRLASCLSTEMFEPVFGDVAARLIRAR